MANIDFDIDFTPVFESLDDLEDRWVEDADWVVGTNVFYSVFLEYGTSKMDPKPFFRPALAELRARGVEGFISDNTRLDVDDTDSTSELIQNLAFALERRIKEIITKKGLIDTGTLRISIRAVPGNDIQALPSLEQAQAEATEDREFEA